MHPPTSDPSPGDQPPGDDIDLDVVAAELADVEVAMERIQSGAYWTDEVTGAPIPDDHLAAHPTSRRVPGEPVIAVAGFAEMAEVLADLDEAADADELDVAELDALSDAEFLAEMGRLDGDDSDYSDAADDLDAELVVDTEPDPPSDPPAR